MNYWRIEVKLELNENPFYTPFSVIKEYGEHLYTKNPEECFLEYQKVKYMDETENRYLLYPKEWIKLHKDAWKDGFVYYAKDYLSSEKVLKVILENKKGKVINPFNNELLYQH